MENRAVVDTNVWVSHVIGGKFYDLAKIALDYDVVYLRSLPLVAEIKEVLSRKKFAKYNIDLDEFINLFLDISTFSIQNQRLKTAQTPKIIFYSTLQYKEKPSI